MNNLSARPDIERTSEQKRSPNHFFTKAILFNNVFRVSILRKTVILFQTNAPFLHPLKMSKNQAFGYFQGYRKEKLVSSGLMALSVLVKLELHVCRKI